MTPNKFISLKDKNTGEFINLKLMYMHMYTYKCLSWQTVNSTNPCHPYVRVLMHRYIYMYRYVSWCTCIFPRKTARRKKLMAMLWIDAKWINVLLKSRKHAWRKNHKNSGKIWMRWMRNYISIATRTASSARLWHSGANRLALPPYITTATN